MTNGHTFIGEATADSDHVVGMNTENFKGAKANGLKFVGRGRNCGNKLYAVKKCAKNVLHQKIPMKKIFWTIHKKRDNHIWLSSGSHHE